MKKLTPLLAAALLTVAALQNAEATGPFGNGGGSGKTTGAGLDSVFGSGPTIEPELLLRTGVGTYGTQNYYYANNDPANMLALRGCLAEVAANQGSCNILYAGDSTTVGFGSQGTGDRKTLSYPTQFANMLNAAGINASWQSWMGCGDGSSCSNDTRITVGSGWSVTSGVITIGGNVLSATSTTSSFAFTPPAPVDTFVIYYVQNPSNGSFSWNGDGGAATTVSTTGTDALASTTVTLSGLGHHTLNLNWVSGTVQIVGTVAYDSSKSWVNVINAGWSGSEATQWALNNGHPWGIVSGPANLGAAATFVDLGINSWNNGTSVATFKSAFATTLSDMPGTVVIMTPAPSATSSAPVATQQQYVTAMYQDAGITIPLIDEYQRIGTYAAANALTPSWYYNSLHPSATGYSDFAGAAYGLTAPLHVSGNVNSLPNGGYGQCQVISFGGAGWTNTGLGTSEENLVSLALPPLGANDALRVSTLWTRGGTLIDSDSLLVRLGTLGCTPQSGCVSGTAFMNLPFATSAFTTVQVPSLWIYNRNATNAQVGFTAAAANNTTTSGAVTVGAIQTNATPFLNFDCTTTASSADSCKLEAYTVEKCTKYP